MIGLICLAAGGLVLALIERHWVTVVLPQQDQFATAVAVDASHPLDQNDGRMVYVRGRLGNPSRLRDPDFGVEAEAVRLRRHVWMYQWREGQRRTQTRIGIENGPSFEKETYNYSQEWADGVIDSRLFHAIDHTNPTQMKIPNRVVTAPEVSLGAYRLAPALLEQVNNFQTIPVVPKQLAKLPADWKAAANEWYVGKDPQQPSIGDLRIRFEFAPPTDVTVVAQQNGPLLEPGKSKAGILRVGSFTEQQVVADFTKRQWMSRGIGWVMGFGISWLGGILVSHGLTGRSLALRRVALGALGWSVVVIVGTRLWCALR